MADRSTTQINIGKLVEIRTNILPSRGMQSTFVLHVLDGEIENKAVNFASARGLNFYVKEIYMDKEHYPFGAMQVNV